MGARSLPSVLGTVVALIFTMPAVPASAGTAQKPSRQGVTLSGPHAGLSCTACHESKPAARTGAGPVSCTRGGCHASLAASFRSSTHDVRRLGKGHEGPTCQECHGGHHVVTGDAALAAVCRQHLDEVCVGCHSAYPGSPLSVGTPVIPDQEATAHPRPGTAAPCGSSTLSCFTCHGSHTVLARDDPNSPVSRERTVETCGRCHAEERERYALSAHARGVPLPFLGTP